MEGNFVMEGETSVEKEFSAKGAFSSQQYRYAADKVESGITYETQCDRSGICGGKKPHDSGIFATGFGTAGRYVESGGRHFRKRRNCLHFKA